MKIDLQQTIAEAEALLAALRELDGAEIDDQARGRAARERRTEASRKLQKLSHQADVIRVTLFGVHLAIRDEVRTDDGGPQAETTN